MVSAAAQEFPQHYPHPGWVEHDPADILSTQIEALRAAVRKAEIDPKEIAAIGITNQRETTFLWERETGACLYNAIVWQCRRTAPIIEQLVADGYDSVIREKTGLVPDAYFAGSKIKWLLDELNLRERAKKGEICFGTVDSFLAWHLVEGHPHVTDATNAGRTMLFNLHTQEWDDELLSILDIPREILPEVVDTAHVVGMLREDLLGERIPVAALVGDQHAALFGQACFKEGDVKNTYGTGCFMLMNAGNQFRLSQCGLLTTMAWRLNGKATYAFEGSVFMAGATIQWLRDEMHMMKTGEQTWSLRYQAAGGNGDSILGVTGEITAGDDFHATASVTAGKNNKALAQIAIRRTSPDEAPLPQEAKVLNLTGADEAQLQAWTADLVAGMTAWLPELFKQLPAEWVIWLLSIAG